MLLNRVMKLWRSSERIKRRLVIRRSDIAIVHVCCGWIYIQSRLITLTTASTRLYVIISNCVQNIDEETLDREHVATNYVLLVTKFMFIIQNFMLIKILCELCDVRSVPPLSDIAAVEWWRRSRSRGRDWGDCYDRFVTSSVCGWHY